MKLTYVSESTSFCDVKDDESIADALLKLGVSHDAPCGGNGKCGKCRVLCEGEVLPPDDEEKNVLGKLINDGYRLACKAKICGDVTVYGKTDDDCTVQNSDLAIPDGVVCVDLGTTYITAAKNCDGVTRFYTFKNPQSVYGADVISRVSSSEDHLDEMSACVKKRLCDFVPDFEKSKKIISANTVMQLIYDKKSPASLGYYPYESPDLFGYEKDGITYMPCIGGFVGGDVVSGLFYAMHTGKITEKTALYIDIGTNGETVLIHNGRMISCAMAAGPCFEGAGLECGMRAQKGAVSAVKEENGKLSVSVIGDTKATGICGSGIVSIIAHLLKTGKLSVSGLLEKEKVFITDDVYITRKDIRSLQGAKAAIGAGISVLCKRMGIAKSDIDAVYIAGTFGEYLDKEAAVSIGLLPDSECKTLGNCSLFGACLCAQDESVFDKICTFARKIEYIELSDDDEFTDEYINASFFE